jgi:hypothetical protein
MLGTGKMTDYSVFAKDGSHPKMSKLSMLHYGITGNANYTRLGPSFEEIALLLEDTASLDRGKK